MAEGFMTASVNAEICIGCTLCTQSCPEVFRMEGDKAVAFVSSVPKQVEESCRRAADECPVSAIVIQ